MDWLTDISFKKPSTWVGLLSLLAGCYGAYGVIVGAIRIVGKEWETGDYFLFGFGLLFLVFFVAPAIYYGFRLIREKSLSNVKGAVACVTIITVSMGWSRASELFPGHYEGFFSLALGTVIYVIGVRILARVEPIHIQYFTDKEPIWDVPVRELIPRTWVGLLAFMLFGDMSRLMRDFRKDAVSHGPDLWHWWEGLIPLAVAVIFYQIVVGVFKLRSDREPMKIRRPSKPVEETGSNAG